MGHSLTRELTRIVRAVRGSEDETYLLSLLRRACVLGSLPDAHNSNPAAIWDACKLAFHPLRPRSYYDLAAFPRVDTYGIFYGNLLHFVFALFCHTASCLCLPIGLIQKHRNTFNFYTLRWN